MGLLDLLSGGDQGFSGFGGLLGGNYYPSKLDPDQMQYDALGNPIGPKSNMTASPFPDAAPSQMPPPQMAAGAPIFAMPQQQAPQAPQPPQPQAAAPIVPQASFAPPIGNAPMDISPPQQDAQLPPNAQQTAGQAPAQFQQPSTQPAFLGPQNPNFGDRANAGLMNFANAGGPLQAIAGAISGLGTGQRTDPQGMQLQNMKAQYESLVPMLGPQKAMLTVMNPEAGKILLEQALATKQKFGVISKDPLEGEKYGFINERDQTINGQPIGAQQPAAGGSMGALQAAKQAGVTGEALYDHLPKAMVSTVKAMIEGRQPLPSTTAMRSPATLALIDAAHSIDPTFDATVWKSRNEAGPDWSKGKSSEMVRSANQTLAHVGSLMDAMDALHNRRIPAWNAVANTLQEQTGAGEQGAFRTNAHAVAEEMSKVFKGANLSDAEIRQWEQNLTENMSPPQQRAQITKLSELLHGSLKALEEKRLSAVGPAMAEKMGPLIKEDGQRVLDRIDKWARTGSKQTSAPGLPQGWSVQVR